MLITVFFLKDSGALPNKTGCQWEVGVKCTGDNKETGISRNCFLCGYFKLSCVHKWMHIVLLTSTEWCLTSVICFKLLFSSVWLYLWIVSGGFSGWDKEWAQRGNRKRRGGRAHTYFLCLKTRSKGCQWRILYFVHFECKDAAICPLLLIKAESKMAEDANQQASC